MSDHIDELIEKAFGGRSITLAGDTIVNEITYGDFRAVAEAAHDAGRNKFAKDLDVSVKAAQDAARREFAREVLKKWLEPVDKRYFSAWLREQAGEQ